MRRLFRTARARAGEPPESAYRIALVDISRRLRGHLASELVVRSAADDLCSTLGARSAVIWLSRGENDPPQLAYSTPELEGSSDPDAPSAVSEALRRRTSVHSRESGRALFAVPLIAPHSGLLGVVSVEHDDLRIDAERFVTDIASETALALETANLFEHALAAKERSETLLARVADAIVVTDTRGTILEANEAAGWLIGASAKQRPTCNEALRLQIGEREIDCSAGCTLLADTQRRAEAAGVEVTRIQPDGRRQPLLASVAAVTNADGEVAEIVHSFRDITRLKQADEAKTLFLATASHELKTPLTVIRGFSQLLSSPRFSNEEERGEAALAIQRRAEQLTRIVDRLLLSGRIEAGRVDVNVELVNVVPTIAEQVDGIRRTAMREVTLDAPTHVRAMADPEAVRTVVDHLLDNAVKYSPAGGPINVVVTDRDGRVSITVRDCGIGMDPDQADHCFDKFWQAESSDVRRFGGTGIGLYIVRSLVEAMNGKIDVETAKERGSAFTMVLVGVGEQPTPEPEMKEAAPIAREPSVIREFMRQLGIPSAQGGEGR